MFSILTSFFPFVRLDVLMKYLYRFLGDPDTCSGSGLVLKWHKKVAEKAGDGAIIRVMTDRKTV